MAFLGLVHNREAILSKLKEQGDRLIALSDLSVYVPYRFRSKSLLYMGNENITIGYIGVSDGTNYAAYTIPAMIKLGRSEINEISVEDEPYYEFKFKKGDAVIMDLNLVMDDSLLYSANDEFIAKGHIPAYMEYEDLHYLFLFTKYYTGINVGANANTMDFFYSTISRDGADLTKQYRNGSKGEVVYIPFRAISLTANSTLARMNGSYADSGINAALIDKTESLNKTEELLRK